MTTSKQKPETPAGVGGEPEELAASLRGCRVRLYIAAFLVDIVSSAYGLVIAAHAEHELLAGPSRLGYLGTTLMGSYALGCLVLGGWSDRFGSMRLMRWGLGLLIVVVMPATLIVGSVGSITGLYFTNAAYGFTLALYWPPLMRELSLLSPGKTLWRSVGAFNICWAIGAALGSFAGPVFYDGLRISISMAALLLLLALAAGVTAMRVPDVRSSRQDAFLPEVDESTGRRFLLVARVSHFCASFALGGVSWVFIYVGDHLGFALATIGLILFSRDIGKLCGFCALRAFSSWHYSFSWLGVVQLIGGAALLLSGFVNEVWQFVALFALLGFFSGVSYYSSLYYGLSLRSGEGGKSGFHEAILATGFCLGPLFSGSAGESFPQWPGVVLVLPGAVILVGLVAQAGLLALGRRTRNGA